MGLLFTAPDLLGASGIFYAFSMSTFAGRMVILLLFLTSVVSWSVMFTKFNQVRDAERNGQNFLHALRAEPQFAEIFRKGLTWHDCPLYELYIAGCRGMQGSAGMDDVAKIKLLEGALERAVAEQVVRLESQISILGTAVSAAPFMGLLGTVWGVMTAFSSVAVQQTATIQTLAPGVSAALLTTIAGLIVAIPSVFGYNILLGNSKRLITELENYASSLADRIELESK